MPENYIEGKKPLWLLIESEIQNYSDSDFSDANRVETSQKIASALNDSGYNVSKSAGNWLQLKTAVEARNSVGRPFIKDFDNAIDALSLDDVEDTYVTTMEIINKLGNDWPNFLASEYRTDVNEIIQKRRIQLVTEKARKFGGEKGIRFLISELFDAPQIQQILSVSESEYNGVKSKVDAELAEIKRVKSLLTAKESGTEEEKIKHLINENVSDELILEIGGFSQSALDSIKKTMEEELAEKKRQEEELAAQKAAEAAGPSLDDISSDDMLEYIAGIREILDFANSEKDIRIMCEQSNIPKALVEIAVNEPDKLDELEKTAEG